MTVASAFAIGALGVLAQLPAERYLDLTQAESTESAPAAAAQPADDEGAPEMPAEGSDVDPLDKDATEAFKPSYSADSLVRSSFWSGDRRLDGNHNLALVQSNLKLRANPSPSITLQADADAASSDHAFGNSRNYAVLREAFAQIVDGNLKLQAGAVLMPWGRVDTFNPTDVLTSRQYTWLTDSDDQQKVAPLALHAAYRSGPHSVELVYQPTLRSGEIPLTTQPGITFTEMPAQSQAAYAAKYTAYRQRVTWSASFFNGPAKRPYLAPNPSDLIAGRIDLEHPATSMLGIDFEAPVSDYVFRGEAAYTRAHRFGDPGITAGINNLSSVLELERNYGTTSAFGEAIFVHNFQYRGMASVDPSFAVAAHAADTVNDTAHRNYVGVGAGLNYLSADMKRSFTVDVAYFPAQGDISIRPRMRYHFTDSLAAYLGGDYLDGPTDGPLGRLRANKLVFVGLEKAITLF
ncbi:MAG: hypothetical protein E6Q76_05320 [Rhizobium sp.]|nr:MAG: hypothetical protein E6Q76_05320 [Rhizobium sp.]